jgi:hypothetical protein
MYYIDTALMQAFDDAVLAVSKMANFIESRKAGRLGKTYSFFPLEGWYIHR